MQSAALVEPDFRAKAGDSALAGQPAEPGPVRQPRRGIEKDDGQQERGGGQRCRLPNEQRRRHGRGQIRWRGGDFGPA